jgi:hypothetical protein
MVTDQNRTYLCEPVGPLRGIILAYAHVNGADFGNWPFATQLERSFVPNEWVGYNSDIPGESGV